LITSVPIVIIAFNQITSITQHLITSVPIEIIAFSVLSHFNQSSLLSNSQMRCSSQSSQNWPPKLGMAASDE
jgi:hypothetical protein